MCGDISIFCFTVNEKHPLELKQGITIATITQDKKGACCKVYVNR